jgi:hypothetical protein
MRIHRHKDMRGQDRSQILASAQTLGQFARTVQGVGPVLARIRILGQSKANLTAEVAQLVLGLTQVAPTPIRVQRA